MLIATSRDDGQYSDSGWNNIKKDNKRERAFRIALSTHTHTQTNANTNIERKSLSNRRDREKEKQTK